MDSMKGIEWARVSEDDRAVKVETDRLEAVIPKKNPKQRRSTAGR